MVEGAAVTACDSAVDCCLVDGGGVVAWWLDRQRADPLLAARSPVAGGAGSGRPHGWRRLVAEGIGQPHGWQPHGWRRGRLAAPRLVARAAGGPPRLATPSYYYPFVVC